MAQESSTRVRPRFMRRLHYWWSMFAAGALLLICAPPILLYAWLVSKHDLVYPWAFFGARAWLFLSGVRVKATNQRVIGHLPPRGRVRAIGCVRAST